MRDISEETLLAVHERFDSFRHAIEVGGQTADFVASVPNSRFASGIEPAVCDSTRGRADLHNGIRNMTSEEVAESNTDRHDAKQTEHRLKSELFHQSAEGWTWKDYHHRVRSSAGARRLEGSHILSKSTLAEDRRFSVGALSDGKNLRGEVAAKGVFAV